MTSATKTRALVGMRSGWATHCHIPVPQYLAPQYFAPQYLAVQPASVQDDAPQYFACQVSGSRAGPLQGGAAPEPATSPTNRFHGDAFQEAGDHGSAVK